MANQLNDVPSSLEPIAGMQLGNKRMELTVSSVWYKFFVSVSAVLSNLVGGVLGFTTEANVVATGTTQGTATPLTTEWAHVSTTPANSGVMLASFGAGVPNTVINRGASTLKVYPPVGSQIDALGPNNPYSLATTKTQTFNQTTDTQYWSTQLG